ncbi:fatty-acid amide hydrolase 2-B-like [Rhodnius prolixus]|uniref:fatty-acid amide hydrolase 2-B-like n=1 Tax=Rhodnius prolixus TaxID=13249 RepID=UPI003D18C142
MWGFFMKEMIRLFQFFIFIFVWPYSKFFSLRTKRERVPSICNPLLTKSGLELAEMIRNQKVTCTEVVLAFITRMQTVNPIINGIVQDRFEDALNQAKLVDEMIQANPDPNYWETTKPLLGVPLTVKECIAVSGMSHNAGRTIPEQRIAKKDAEAVANLRSAGAIPIAVTNTPELCYFWESYNRKTGLTKNPYDVQRTAGGSSGGECAMLGAGASTIGLGSDVIGSGRLPAHFCGVFGHKPSSHIISNDGHIPNSSEEEWDEFLVMVPLSTHAVDLPIILTAAAPKNAQFLNLDKPVDFSTIKVFYLEEQKTLLTSKIHPDIKDAIRRSAFHFKQYGVQPEKAYISKFDNSLEALSTIMMRMKAPNNIFQRSEDPQDFSMWDVLREVVLDIFGCSKFHTYSVFYGFTKKCSEVLPKSYETNMRKLKEELGKYMEELLGDCGVLILPVFFDTAHKHYRMYYKFTNVIYLSVANLLGIPATVCPAGLSKSGLPFGIQIIANRNQDRLTLAVAKELENVFGGWTPVSAEESNNLQNIV